MSCYLPFIKIRRVPIKVLFCVGVARREVKCDFVVLFGFAGIATFETNLTVPSKTIKIIFIILFNEIKNETSIIMNQDFFDCEMSHCNYLNIVLRTYFICVFEIIANSSSTNYFFFSKIIVNS